MSFRDGPRSRRSVLASLFAASLASSARAQTTKWGDGPPLLRTTRSQFIELRPLNEVPDLTLERIDGKMIPLNAFRGRPVLVNFWATWCPPCRRELPLLDELSRTMSEPSVAIVAVSIDQAGRPTVEAFLKRVGVTSLRPFVDPLGRVVKQPGSAVPTPFTLWGMPISYIIDRAGRIAGYITGEVEWSSQQGRAFLEYYVHA
jgi:thiol-disulfide isomerase/thioredoxin